MKDSSNQNSKSRRRFIGELGLLAAASALDATPLLANQRNDARGNGNDYENRADECYELRVHAAKEDFQEGMPRHPVNGDSAAYRNHLANYSKGLVHDGNGIVDGSSYDSLLKAVHSGDPKQFERIQMGGTRPLVNPQCGLAYDMEGLDSHQYVLGPPAAFYSDARGAEAVEVYWAALLRDIAFTQYGNDPKVLAACTDLSKLPGYIAPKVNGKVTPETLFRGLTPGDNIGPYISQFLLRPFEYGAISIQQMFTTYEPGVEYLTDFASWLAVQNGVVPSESNQIDPQRRFMRNGRDLAAYVHIDVLFEAYFNACIWLLDNGAPLNPSNPYIGSKTQTGFGTFGGPHVKALVAEVSQRALKAVWYQKWFVHRTLRPEEYGGRVQAFMGGLSKIPIHSSLLNSQALAEVYSRFGTYLMPHAFPEGCPTHPAYGSGHSTVAGACVTVLKSFFDENWVIPDPMVPSEDGLSLVPYTGPDAGQMTVLGELNKVANNVGMGRIHAGVHWRSDNTDSLALGEEVALSILRDQKHCYSESAKGTKITKFDGTKIII